VAVAIALGVVIPITVAVILLWSGAESQSDRARFHVSCPRKNFR